MTETDEVNLPASASSVGPKAIGLGAQVTCDQPEPAELGFSLLAFGAVAGVSVPVEYASTGITFCDFLQRLGQRLLFAYVSPVFR